MCFRDGSHQSQSPERGFESFRQPSPQKAGDRSRGRLRRPATLLCRVERCRILVRLSDGGLERLLERALVGSGGTFSRFTPQPWAFHPLRFHDHRHPVFEAPEIADSALGDRRDLVLETAAEQTSTELPRLRWPRGFSRLRGRSTSINAITGPYQNPLRVAVSQTGVHRDQPFAAVPSHGAAVTFWSPFAGGHGSLTQGSGQ